MLKYYPFGESRNSPQNSATDILFTGQRLDGSGLYYYGARYYDPSIGRFISADVIIQNMSNPQSLNRYSYCTNNPLKYTDPTGMKFVCDTSWEQNELDAAYEELMNNSDIDPWIKEYMLKLHDSDRVIDILFANIEGGIGISQIDFGLTKTPDVIMLDKNFLQDTEGLAAVFAHECYHIYEHNPGATIEEETRAYYVEYRVGSALHWSGTKDSVASSIYSELSSYGIDRLDKNTNIPETVIAKEANYLQKLIGSAGDTYRAMPKHKNEMNRVSLVNQGLNAAGHGGTIMLGLALYIQNQIIPPYVPIHGNPWN